MELPEEVIVRQVRNGTLLVVYPGTNIPWATGDGKGPSYCPPDRFPGI